MGRAKISLLTKTGFSQLQIMQGNETVTFFILPVTKKFFASSDFGEAVFFISTG
jgi:hypothetical protein